MKTINWTRLGQTAALSLLVAYLVKTGGQDALVKSLMGLLVGLVMGAQESFVTHQRSTDPQPPKDTPS